MTRRILPALAVTALVVAGLAGGATPPTTLSSGTLTVGIAMPSEGFQVGIVKGTQVVYAQGFEIDLARALASRLGLGKTVFVQNRFDRLTTGGDKPYDVAIAEISVTPARARVVEFSKPYLAVDQGVLAAQTVRPAPTSLAALRSLRICALSKSTGAEVAQQRIAPTTPVMLIGNVPTLMLDLQTGRCDAVVYDAPALGTLKARAPARYGPFAGVIRTRERYAMAMPKGATLVGPLNAALTSLLADGTVDRLERKWLTFDPSKARVLG